MGAADKVVVVRLALDSGQYSTELARAAAQTRGFAGSVQGSATATSASVASFGRVAATFGKVVTLGVAGGLALSAKAAIDFESSFAGVEKTISATPQQFDRLRQEIRKLATEIPISVNELNKIAELGGQLGVEVSGIETFTRTIAELGVTTNLSTETAALGISRLAAITGTSEAEFSNMGSTLVALGNNFETTEDQILTFATRIASTATVVGLTVDQIFAIATAFSSVGVPAERGGTAVQKVFIAMSRAVSESGDELEAFAAIAGVSVDRFVDLFETDASRAFEAFISGLGTVEERGQNVFEILDRVGLGADRTVQAILAQAVAQGRLGDALTLASTAYTENNALQEEAEKRFATTASQIEIAKNKFKDLGIEIGTAVLPHVNDFLDSIGDIAVALKELSPATKTAIGAFLLLTSGMVVTQKLGKILINQFGIQLPIAMRTTTIAAALMRGVVGVGIVGAVSLAAVAFSKWAEAKAETAGRIDELVASLREEKEGIEGVTKATLVQGLSEQIDLFNRLGISIDRFAGALLGNEKDVDSITRTLGGLSTEADLLREALGRGFTGQDPTRDLAALGFDAESAAQRIEDLGDAYDIFGGRTNELSDAQERLRDELDAQAQQEQLDAIADGYGSVGEKMAEMQRIQGLVDRALGKTGDAAGDSAQGFNELEEAIAAVSDEMRRQTDSAFAFVDSVITLVQAQEAFNQAGGDNFQMGLDLARSFEEVRRAAAELGIDGLDPLIGLLEEMRRQGYITDEQLLLLLNDLTLFGPVANQMSGATSIITGNMGLIGAIADETGIPVDTLKNKLLQMNGAIAGVSLNLYRFSQSLRDLRDSGKGSAGGLDNVIGAARGFMNYTIPAFTDVGGQIRNAINRGISGGGGGGGGGASGPSIADTITSELEDALSAAQKQVDSILRAVDATLTQRGALDDLKTAEQDLVDLRREQVALPDKILAAESRLAAARAAAAAVTTDELLEIEAAQEALERARLAFEQGRITATELRKAEEDLAEAFAASTRVAGTEAVVDAEEELAELKARGLEIENELVAGEKDLLDAKLAVLDAQLSLIEAGRTFNELGLEAIGIFRQVAQEAGLTAETINSILGLANTAGSTAGNTSFGAVQPSLSGNREYIVQSGDTLSAIASRLGISLAELINLNSTVTNQNGKSRSLNPNLIFPGDILKYEFGGVVPGYPGQPQLAVVHGGERIYNPAKGQEPGVNIGTLVLRGVFDFTNPGVANKIMDTLEHELDARRMAKAGSRY